MEIQKDYEYKNHIINIKIIKIIVWVGIIFFFLSIIIALNGIFETFKESSKHENNILWIIGNLSACTAYVVWILAAQWIIRKLIKFKNKRQEMIINLEEGNTKKEIVILQEVKKYVRTSKDGNFKVRWKIVLETRNGLTLEYYIEKRLIEGLTIGNIYKIEYIDGYEYVLSIRECDIKL